MSERNPKENMANAGGGEPSRPRKRELALLYAALAKDLVDWKDKNPDDDELGNIPEKPVVWELHQIAVQASKEVAELTIEEAATAMNATLASRKDRLGQEHKLETAQVRMLVELMVENHEFVAMAPYRVKGMDFGW